MKTTKLLLILLFSIAVAACGGGGGSSSSNGGTSSYTIDGNISGLTGTGLVLQDNGGNNLSVTGNGSVNFTTQLPTSSTYVVTVLTQPSGQTCTVTNGNGTVNNANVTNIAVSCSTTTTTFNIGETVSGLTGTGLVLQNNGGDNLSATVNGSGSFATRLPTNSAYSVTVFTQPSGQTCTVTNGTGTVNNADVTNVTVSCSANSTSLSCVGGNGSGTNGIRLYDPANIFSYQLSTTTANAPDISTLGWGAAYTGSLEGAYTGSLFAELWAVSSSYSGGLISGTILGSFIPNFTGSGAYSSSQIASGGYSTNTIVSSSSNYNPTAGQRCLVITLLQYAPGQCSPNPNGYCIVDWLQFNAPVTFH